MTPLLSVVEHYSVENANWKPYHELQHMWLKDAANVPLGCQGAIDQYLR